MNTSVTLLNEDNQEIALETLWERGPVLLFFMRQLGCGLCRQQLLRLKKHADQFKAANCSIAVIIMGDGKMARGLKDLYTLPFPVYADPSMNAYAAFDIGEGTMWQVLNPGIVMRQLGTMAEGMRPYWGAGSIKQLGGLVIVMPGGDVRYRHVANPIYRYPPWAEVLAALNQSPAPPPVSERTLGAYR